MVGLGAAAALLGVTALGGPVAAQQAPTSTTEVATTSTMAPSPSTAPPDPTTAPDLVALSPDTGASGDRISAIGQDFVPDHTQVLFGSYSAAAEVQQEDGPRAQYDTARVIVPVGLQPGPIVVRVLTPNGQSNALTFTVPYPGPQGYLGPPEVAAVDPGIGAAGAGGASEGPELVRTGSGSAPLTVLGTGLLLAGAGCLVVRRRLRPA